MRQALACRHAFQRLGPHRCGLASRRLRSAHPFVGPALGSHRRWKCGHNRGARFSDARLCNGRPRHVETAPACSLTHITFKASQTQSFQRNNVPRRTILTERQRQSLFRLPDDAPTLLRHYVLSDEDLDRIRRRRGPRNRLGLALQLCALRYPGRLLQPSEAIPEPMLAFVAAQLGLAGDDLLGYGIREATRYQHSAMLQHLYGYRSFEGRACEEMKPWINRAAELAQTNDQFAADLVAEFRKRKTIVPRAFTVERLCADALVAAERRITTQITGRLNHGAKARLLSLLRKTVDDRLTRFVWLRQFEPGSKSADMNRMLDRLDALRELDIDPRILEGVPSHRVGRLRRQGERYYADGLRELPENRKLAILAVCVIEWRAMVTDAIVETHDRIVGKLFRTCERRRDEHLRERRGAIGDALKSFSRVGAAILSARDDEAGLATAGETSCGWQAFEKLVEQATALTSQIVADPLDFVTDGYARFRRYAPRLLDSLSFCGGQAATSLLSAIDVLRALNRTGNRSLVAAVPISFVRPKRRSCSSSAMPCGPATSGWQTADAIARLRRPSLPWQPFGPAPPSPCLSTRTTGSRAGPSPSRKSSNPSEPPLCTGACPVPLLRTASSISTGLRKPCRTAPICSCSSSTATWRPSASQTFCSRLIIGLASQKPSAICGLVHRAAIGSAC